MPQLQNLVLTDRATTPVDHTFTPLDIQAGVGAVVETTGVPIGNNKFTIGLSKTANNRYRAVANLTVPVVVNETINGVTRPTVARTGYAQVTFTFDESSTEQERKDLVGMLASSLDASKALTNDTIVKLQGVY
jgi:hypothetical protein